MAKNTVPKRATGVHQRSGSNVWQWRIKVPKDLTHLYPGQQWAHRCTLGTSDLRDANLKADALATVRTASEDGLTRAISTEVEARLDDLQWRLSQQQVRVVTLSDAEAMAAEVADWVEAIR